MLDISRVTVRKALTDLVEEGVLTQRRGSGTFVTSGATRVEQRLSRLTSFTEDMLARGLTPSVRWLLKTVAPPTPEEAMVLGLSTGEKWSSACAACASPTTGRWRWRQAVVAGAAAAPIRRRSATRSMPRWRHAGIRPVRALAAPVGREPERGRRRADAGPRAPGAPALYIERISYLKDGRAVEFTKSHYRGDAYDFVVELTTEQLSGGHSGGEAAHERGRPTAPPGWRARPPSPATRWRACSTSRAMRSAPPASCCAIVDPRLVAICARGSSNHAAAFFKYATETQLGLPVVAIGPSIASVYHTPLRLEGAVMLVISQSGRSPDLLAMAKAAQQGGAKNHLDRQRRGFAGGGDGRSHHSYCTPGPEKSVAATKSCIASMAAGLAVLGRLVARPGAQATRLPQLPAGAAAPPSSSDWSALVEPFVAARSALIVGRGIGYPVAMEAALKLKETASLHAEPYSAAEVLHGPISDRARRAFPVLLFRQNDAAAGDSIDHCADRRFAEAGARMCSSQAPAAPKVTRIICRSSPSGASRDGAAVGDGDPATATVDRIARARGFDPDTPPLLKKVTETL